MANICHGKQRPMHLRERRAHIADPKQPQIHHQHKPAERAHADDVGDQNPGIEIQRLPDGDAAWKRLHPFEQGAERRHLLCRVVAVGRTGEEHSSVRQSDFAGVGRVRAVLGKEAVDR
jgi:hypothetical protein